MERCDEAQTPVHFAVVASLLVCSFFLSLFCCQVVKESKRETERDSGRSDKSDKDDQKKVMRRDVKASAMIERIKQKIVKIPYIILIHTRSVFICLSNGAMLNKPLQTVSPWCYPSQVLNTPTPCVERSKTHSINKPTRP